MQWQQFWDKQAEAADADEQVGRITRDGKSVAPEVIASHISSLLDLQPTDYLLDVCCGNGALTALLAEKVAFSTGVDLSPKQIELAKKRYPAGDWYCLAADQLWQLSERYHKINLYFSFQYFTHDAEALAVMMALKAVLKPGGRILLGDIPDLTRWAEYYHSWPSRMRWMWHRLRGKDNMGRFWHQKDMARLANQAGLNIRFLAEPAHLPFAWYRFDALLEHADTAATAN